ncbi:hypothetical protein MM213_15535 [Belliella sp. R4-6]|uniref:Uncharacterized protein n=1 Tax=Belliella alkalica TaxID=1730871 RepID=A0ABS9VEQ6_9BACT|nr:hypothetical protein [Belliella alkalica]MCH7414912.1 hypothetical protein [Belliella alkalica]
MKKLILFSLMMFSGLFLGQNIAQDSGGDGLEEPCEESIDSPDEGGPITVTVCNRRTNGFGYLMMTFCNAPANEMCQFTNL